MGQKQTENSHETRTKNPEQNPGLGYKVLGYTMTTFGMIGGEGGRCWGLQYYDYMRENICTYYNFGNYKHRDLHSYAVEGLEIFFKTKVPQGPLSCQCQACRACSVRVGPSGKRMTAEGLALIGLL